MTLTEQVKILDDKIKENKAPYVLDTEAAKISELSSGELEKLTGRDLGYKPDVIQKPKSEYSPLGKIFNKSLDESDKKEGFLKRLKNIEGKNKDQLDVIKDQGEKQLDATEKQKENKPKINEKDEKLVYLRDRINCLKCILNLLTKKAQICWKFLHSIKILITNICICLPKLYFMTRLMLDLMKLIF